MKRKMGTITVISFALVIMLGAAWPAQGQYTSYATMAPLEQYLIADRSAEIASARTAVPESISRDAEVLVLGGHGYETGVKGKNSFVCMVQRSWAAGVDDPEFWNPKLRAPHLLQRNSHKILSSTHHQEDRLGIGRTIQSANVP